MKVRKIWIAVLCIVIGVVWWVVRPQSLVHVAGIAEKAEQITRYSISAVDDDVEQCWVTEPEDMQEIWKALETSKVTFDGDQVMYHLRIYEGEEPVAELGFLDDGRVLGDTWEYRYKGENPAAWTQMLEGLLEKYIN